MSDSTPPKPDHASIQAQLASPSYRLAALDRDFLLGDSMRGVRFMLEYAKAEETLRRWKINSTIVVFGSARVGENETGRRGRWYAQARDFGRLCSERSRGLNGDGEAYRNVIATGGGPGVMEAANRGAFEAGAPSIGFNITLPHEQFPNPYTTPELTFQFHYFAMRKMHLAMRARALIVFPGGFGTFDELFELMTLVQTGKTHRLPIVLFDEEFWTTAINFEALVEAGTISPDDPKLFCYANSAEDVWSRLVERGLHMMPDEPHTT
ncbi:MAG: TIGR00730 family Rossman fold protein [Hyphomicrobiales bacterium]|nr:TIGR00730 family Rossman fold protein [Hyphomicrobiales bacterium]